MTTNKPTEQEAPERDQLVKKFAYEYVRFNHDPNHCYLVTNITDDCMLEIEGMSGQFAPSCFNLAPQPKQEPTVGADGRYCAHHDDDPAHTEECYEVEQERRIEEIERWLMLHVPYRSNPNADRARAFGYLRFLLDLVKREKMVADSNLTNHDKTRFLERGFAVVENARHTLRLIERDDPRHAISIKWDDLPALRELITLALDDGPMVIGLDASGQSAQNAATAMRDACVEKVKSMAEQWRQEASKAGRMFSDKTNVATKIAAELESVTLDQVKQK